MTFLPSGLASISSQFDDSPQVRGAVAFGRMVREARDLATTADQQSAAEARHFPKGGTAAMRNSAAVINSLPWYGLDLASPDLTSAIDRHAALAIGSAYRSADRR